MNDKRPNFWVRGKIEQNNFYNLNLQKSTSRLTFFYGLILAALVLVPIGILIYQFLNIYVYNISNYFIFLGLIWIGLMFFNAFSNYFTVRIAQSSVKDMVNLQKINAKDVFIYQLLNIGFGLTTLLILIIFGIRL